MNHKFTDYLLQNVILGEAAVLEITTPASKLLGGYRGVRNVSSELTSTILESKDYKQSLLKTLKNLKSNYDKLLPYFNF